MSKDHQDDTLVIHAGRHPERFNGVVNTPVIRGSTILSSTLEEWQSKKKAQRSGVVGTYYGRFGTPTTHALQEAIAELEGGYRSLVYPSGLAACSGALLSFVSTGDHVLMTDSAYSPTRSFAIRLLKRMGVETTFYSPSAGESIDALIRPNTKVLYVESPGSETLEMQDVPTLARIGHAHGLTVIADNTWGTPLYFKAFEHGVDVSIQAATKYIVGHSDAMLGVVTCNEASWPQLKQTTQDLGYTAGPDDIYLALRGLRTMAVRLKQHFASGVRVAEWLSSRPEVDTVLHPALPSHPGHTLWKRDYLGACGLFSIVLKPAPVAATTAFIDSLQLFGLGASWGGYESLIVPFNPDGEREVAPWPYTGQAYRLHVGLEDIDDLIGDLTLAFDAMKQHL
ncbi:Cystathionine beta-lyase MetC [Paraburkholderia aspalathi]|uniref:cystathionine beta-lyase n=1 Tax=Paraburkholderia aspalathi TaxID=1324617 RepID=UPI00190C600D|nr:cystathionine beta-lyase [Paraburkholderia aspalathi]MBK3843200.1 cystathionine beta-lyase [Paraburkholderia aspalathi]CAE6847980.1 Cystathionine beta-lyase MetC [Paraburkholderia aspalathi]CAE6858047.1 Cystathionine beta-lyase MetC [Paraburkholderia aspalathi]